MKENEVRVNMLKKSEEETPSLKYPWHLFSMVKYLFDKNLEKKLFAYKKKMYHEIKKKGEKLSKIGYKKYLEK